MPTFTTGSLPQVTMHSVDFTLYLISDRLSLPAGRTLEDAIASALDGGLRAVQLREKDLPDHQFEALAEKLRRLTARYNAKLLLNSRCDIAQRVEADGVHLGVHSPPVAQVRRQMGSQALIGVSTHHQKEIALARKDGADFVTFGPVFATPSKTGMGQPAGLKALHRAKEASSLPLFALGGIDLASVDSVLATEVAGIALIRAIQNAEDPAHQTRLFLRKLGTIKQQNV